MDSTKQSNHGGQREGAGAKPKYGEKTCTIAFRVPESLAPVIKKMVSEKLVTCEKRKFVKPIKIESTF